MVLVCNFVDFCIIMSNLVIKVKPFYFSTLSVYQLTFIGTPKVCPVSEEENKLHPLKNESIMASPSTHSVL